MIVRKCFIKRKIILRIMAQGIKILYEGGVGELEEKKSRFIATVKPVKSEEEAIEFIESLKKKYWNATHNCSAYVLGEHFQIQRCSDDGEPSGTAGVPILKVLQASGIDNAILVVIRYFGGIKLGAGGVLRAYSNSASLVIKNSQIREKNHYSSYFCAVDYSIEQLFTNNIKKLGGNIIEKEYLETVNFKFYLKNKNDLEELNTLFLGQLDFKYIGEEEIIS